MPPGKSGDYAWVQHMIKSMAPKTGRMAVVLRSLGRGKGDAIERVGDPVLARGDADLVAGDEGEVAGDHQRPTLRTS